MRLFSGVLDSSSAALRSGVGSASAAFARLGFSRVPFGRANPSSMTAPSCEAAASSSAAAATHAGAGAGAGTQKPWLFVGLGNPGRMYKGTRHNVGFDIIDAIAEAEGISVISKQFKAIVGKDLIGDVPVMLAKPQTFMNASGESVGQLVSYFKIPLNQLVVDEEYHEHLKQSRNFPRLRIGIGRPPEEMGAIGFFLRSFSKEEKDELEVTFQRGVQAVRIIVQEGFNKSAKFVNTPPPPAEMLNS